MGRILKEGEPPREPSRKISSIGNIDILAEAGKIAASALQASFQAEIDDATHRAEACGCPNCRRDVTTVYEKAFDMSIPTKGRIIHEPILITGTGRTYPRESVSWLNPKDLPPSEWHGMDSKNRPHGVISRDEDEGGID